MHEMKRPLLVAGMTFALMARGSSGTPTEPVLARGSVGSDSVSTPPTRRPPEGAGDSRHRYSNDRIWERRLTIRELEDRVRRAPADVQGLNRLGEAYYDGQFLHRARATFERAIAVDSSDADARFGLGRICQREWLDAPDVGTLNQAARHFEAAVRARPDFYEAWVVLATIRFERRDPWTARAAAMAGLSIAPGSVQAQLAAAYLSYRTGLLERSDSLFALAIPRCPAGIAQRFADITPLLSEAEQQDYAELAGPARDDYRRRFWSRSDPDPTTTQNEARLEFWSRIAHALLLIGDPWSPRWLGRTDLYARYGRLVQIERAHGPKHTEMPQLDWGEIAIDPTPEALQSLGQNAVSGGQAVFAPLPPGVVARPLESLVSRFEGPSGPRLAAMVETPGAPVDSIVADCVVIGADEREVARGSRVLSPSACDPAERRAGEFVFELRPGHYRISFAVRDDAGGRGVAHAEKQIVLASPALGMSDLVLACGPTGVGSMGGIQLEPNMRARVEGEQSLFAYFEVYHLSQDDRGTNRFEYEYNVRELADNAPRRASRGPFKRGAPRMSFRSTQEGVGSLRRQFISVPTASLPLGRYRLSITVRDALAGTQAEQWADFMKGAVER